MRPTLQYIKNRFEYYNKLCFGGALPQPPIRLNTRYGSLGLTNFRTVAGRDGKVHYTNLSIEISVRRDLPEEEYTDTLLHEMIHYWIMVNDLMDDSPHGTIFRQKMQEITRRYGLKITIDFDPGDEALVSTRAGRWRYVAVVELNDGQTGFAVVARGKLFELWATMPLLPDVKEVKWYASDRAIFEKFPTFVSPKLMMIEANKINHYLTGAVELENEGRIIKPKE